MRNSPLINLSFAGFQQILHNRGVHHSTATQRTMWKAHRAAIESATEFAGRALNLGSLHMSEGLPPGLDELRAQQLGAVKGPQRQMDGSTEQFGVYVPEENPGRFYVVRARGPELTGSVSSINFGYAGPFFYPRSNSEG